MNRVQHSSNNDVLKAPKNMPIEECMALAITRITYADGTPALATYWQPTAYELFLLNGGHPVRVICLGNSQPPMKLGIAGDMEEGDPTL